MILKIKVQQIQKNYKKENNYCIKDFNKFGDDVKEISKAELNKLSRFEQFEKRFPFYKMDVNRFILLI